MAVQSSALRRQVHADALQPITAASNPLTGLAVRCFGAGREIPLWLLQPSLSLQALGRPQNALTTRLAAAKQTVEAVDDLFAVHLPAEWSWFQSNEAGGLMPQEVLPRWTDLLFTEGGEVLHRQLLGDMAAAGTQLRSVVQVDEHQRAWLHRYFMERIYPLLTPLAVDSGHPFPFISSESINLLVELRRPDMTRGRSLYARVKIPSRTSCWIRVPAFNRRQMAAEGYRGYGMPLAPQAAATYVWSADLVRFFVHHLFPGMPVRRVYLFRVVRGEASLPDCPQAPNGRNLRQEDRPVVRLDVERRMEETVLAWLTEHLRIPPYAVTRHDYLADWLAMMRIGQDVLDTLAPAESDYPRFGQTG